MNIDGFQTGSQYIMLYEAQFKDKEDFEDTEKFLNIILPKVIAHPRKSS